MTGDDWILAGLIFGAATLYSTVGHAGASGYLAAMAFFGLAPAVMRPTALALNILVASIATIRFARAGLVDLKLLVTFAAASVPMAFLGGVLVLPSTIYRPLVGILLLLSAVHLAYRAGRASLDDAATHRPPVVVAALIGGAIGLLAGLVGTGGGIFLSPVLLLMHWTDTRRASGIAAAFILANSIAGLAGTTFFVGMLPAALPLWGLAAFAGAIVGTQLGARLLPLPAIRYALAAVLVVAAGKMILT